MVLLLGCSSKTTLDLERLQRIIDAKCACRDIACLYAIPEGGNGSSHGLTLDQWRGFDQPTQTRVFALTKRGDRCETAINARAELATIKRWADEMCACKTAACATALERSTVKEHWSENERMDRGLVFQVAAHDVARFDRCYAALVPREPDPPSRFDHDGSELGQRLVAATERMCACFTLPCAEAIDTEFIHYSQWGLTGGVYSALLDDASPAAARRYPVCHARARRF